MKTFYFTLILFFISVSFSFSAIVISERIGDEISYSLVNTNVK